MSPAVSWQDAAAVLPAAAAGFDLALTELFGDSGHFFLVQTGSALGEELLIQLPGQAAREDQGQRSQELVAAADRSIEMVYACAEALRISRTYRRPEQPLVAAPWWAGRGRAITEAPRGILYHRYTVDDQGVIQNARLVPPTSQNQKTIEADICRVAEQHLNLDDGRLTHILEQAIRNYDPCISCATQ